MSRKVGNNYFIFSLLSLDTTLGLLLEGFLLVYIMENMSRTVVNLTKEQLYVFFLHLHPLPDISRFGSLK